MRCRSLIRRRLNRKPLSEFLSETPKQCGSPKDVFKGHLKSVHEVTMCIRYISGLFLVLFDFNTSKKLALVTNEHDLQSLSSRIKSRFAKTINVNANTYITFHFDTISSKYDTTIT